MTEPRQVTPRFKTTAPPKQRGWNSTLAKATKPINAVSERQRDIENAYIEQKRLVHQRSGRRCEMPAGTEGATACTGRAREVHHVIERSLGRDDSLPNLRDLCLACHRWATVNTVKAKQIFADNPLGLHKKEQQ